MAKPYRYRNRWRPTNAKSTPPKLWADIKAGKKTPTVWKVQDTVSGFYWTGRADHTKFYDQEGKSWESHDAALASLNTLLGNANDSDFSTQRLSVRLQAMKKWQIIECKTRVTKVGEPFELVLVEQEVMNEIFKEGRTMGNVFARALADNTSEGITGLVHLNGYVTDVKDILDGMSIPEDMVKYHRTVLEVRENKWLMLLKLSLPIVKQTLNVQGIRERVISNV